MAICPYCNKELTYKDVVLEGAKGKEFITNTLKNPTKPVIVLYSCSFCKKALNAGSILG